MKNTRLLYAILFAAFVAALIPTRAKAEEPIYLYDLAQYRDFNRADVVKARQIWDEILLVSTLQGLVNRDSATLYLHYVQAFGVDTDNFWLELFSKEIPCEPPQKGWLQDREKRPVESLDQLLELFKNAYQGVVLYDENVPATVNAALTVAGAENLLPIRYDAAKGSLYDRIVLNGPKLPVKVRLVNEDGSALFTAQGKIPGTNLDSSGSAKADVYYWTIENYIKTGKSNPTEGAYYIDAYWITHPYGAVQNCCLTNRDFGVANKAFFFDLSPWEDETPVDDPNQPLGADFRAFLAIMKAAYDATEGKKVVRVAGFTPWDTKYTDYANIGGKHGGVPTEWRHAEILSNYNAYLDADALGLSAMANASFYRHFPLEDLYPQKKPTLDDLKAKGYVDENGAVANKNFVAIYAGDYDSSAWLYQSMPKFWFDEVRGQIPVSWAFNPNLADRFAPGMHYIRKTQSPNDFFTSGDSGAGYVNPTGFEEPRRFSGLPDGLDVWIEHCKPYFKRWDLSGIGFLIDGDARTSDRKTLERLAQYAPDGITTHRGPTMGVVDAPDGGKTAYRPMNWDLSNPEHGAGIILGDTRLNRGAQFNVYRIILWSPENIKKMFELVKQNETLGPQVEFVDAYTFWALLRIEAENSGKDDLEIRL